MRREGHVELLTLIALILFPLHYITSTKHPFKIMAQSTVSFDSFMYHIYIKKTPKLLIYREAYGLTKLENRVMSCVHVCWHYIQQPSGGHMPP